MNKFLKLALSVVVGSVALAVVMFTVWALIHHTAPFLMGLGFGMILIAFIKGAWDVLSKLEKKKNEK